MTYNLTNVATNSTGVLQMAQVVNEVLMFGWLGTLFLIAIFLITYMSFYFATQDVKKAITGSCFISFGLSLSLRAMDLIPDLALYVTLVLSASAIAFTWKTG